MFRIVSTLQISHRPHRFGLNVSHLPSSWKCPVWHKEDESGIQTSNPPNTHQAAAHSCQNPDLLTSPHLFAEAGCWKHAVNLLPLRSRQNFRLKAPRARMEIRLQVGLLNCVAAADRLDSCSDWIRFARISFLSRLSGSHFLWWCHHLCFLQLPRTPLNLLCKPEWTSCISRLESWPTLAFDLGGDKVKQQHFWVKSPLPRRRCTSQGEVWWLYSSFRLLFSLGNFQKYQSVCWVTLGGIFAHTGLGRWSPWRQLSFLFFPLGNVQHRALRGDASEVSTNKEKV